MSLDSSGTNDQTAGKQSGSLSANPISDQNQDLWQRFAEASNPKIFCETWLALQCRMLPGIRSALFLLGTPDTGPFTPAAIFPHATFNVTHLTSAAERSLKERRGLVIKPEVSDNGQPKETTDGYHIAYPIDVSGKIHGVIVLDVKEMAQPKLQAVLQQIHWGVAWIEVLLRRAEAQRSNEINERLQKVLDAVASVVEHERFQAAAMELVTRLATTLECDRVSVGFVQGKNIRVSALSHTSEFKKDANLLRTVESAMDEAADQDALIVYPLPSDVALLVTRAHDSLGHQQDAAAICTVPLKRGPTLYGALTLERRAERPFDEVTVNLIKSVAALTGPILEVKRKEERWIGTKVVEAGKEQARKFANEGHLGLKLTATLTLLAIIFFAFAKGAHRVKAPTVLEGLVQRAVSAPFDGFVVEAPARPGDLLRQGALLCRLDDRELKLERLRWSTQKEQFLKQNLDAMSKHDRAEALINEAKMDQAEAQVSLLDEQLNRTAITAPFDGIVTSGDFSHSLGTAVERGQVLFEMAPLRGYRVIVQVDEKDIGWVAVGQDGELVLPSVPGTVFPMTVTRITPISTAKEGRNYFRVEADLKQTSERLRPGMEGVGKVSCGRARLIWIWTHEIIEWIRLKSWSWLP